MKKLATIAAAMLLLTSGAALAAPPVVLDGDTIIDEQGTHWRLAGINAPEIAHPDFGKPKGEPLGDEARMAMITLMGQGPVTCTQEGVVGGLTSYERQVGFCSVNGVDLGEAIIAEGLACRWPRFDPTGRYEAAEMQARHDRIGIWNQRYRSKGCRP